MFGYLSIQNAIVCFPNTLGILLYMFVTSNVSMSVLGSLFCSMELKLCMLSLIHRHT